jgi:hypothetical protein
MKPPDGADNGRCGRRTTAPGLQIPPKLLRHRASSASHSADMEGDLIEAADRDRAPIVDRRSVSDIPRQNGC